MRLALLLLIGLLGLAPATADETGFGPATAVIDGQMRAFLADDGSTAYSFAAPNIKRLFPTVGAFMSMVEQGYPPVRRPRDY